METPDAPRYPGLHRLPRDGERADGLQAPRTGASEGEGVMGLEVTGLLFPSKYINSTYFGPESI